MCTILCIHHSHLFYVLIFFICNICLGLCKKLRLIKWFVIAMSYMIYIYFDDYRNETNDIINVITQTWKVWNTKKNRYRTCNTDESILKLNKQFEKVFNVYTYEEDEEDEEDDDDESETDSD